MIDTVLSIDVGTTGCKVIAFDQKGDHLRNGYAEYQTEIGPEGKNELNAELVWENVVRTVQSVCDGSFRVCALSVSSLGEAAVLLDGEDRVLGNSILYSDARGREEIDSLPRAFTAERIPAITGQPLSHLHTLWKLLWIRGHQPEVYGKARKALFFADFVVYRLCGATMTDRSLASRSMMYDIGDGRWSREILDAVGISEDLLPQVVQAGTEAGVIRSDMARLLHIDQGARVIIGGHDQPCGLLGSGGLEPGQFVNAGGTIECINCVVSDRDTARRLTAAGYAIEPHVIGNGFMVMGVSVTGGTLLKWYRSAFLPEGMEPSPYTNAYGWLDAQIDGTPGSLLMFPYLMGTGAPTYRPEASASLWGIRPTTTKLDIYKACLEGLSFELRQIIESITDLSEPPRSVCVIGGGAHSARWVQMKADIYGVPVHTVRESEAVSTGLAMLSAVSIGWFSSAQAAAKAFVKVKDVYQPIPEHRDEQNRKYGLFCELCGAASRPVSHS